MVPAAPQSGRKRANDEPTQTLGLGSSSEPWAKKPRFDQSNPLILARDGSDNGEEEEDSVLDFDVLGRRTKNRKGVNLDGYDSDSEHENVDARISRKAREAGLAARLERAEDIFAEEGYPPSDDNNEPDEDKAKKDVRFLNVDDIEGQEYISKLGEGVMDASSSSEGATDDEGRAQLDSDVDEELGAGAKKRHAPRLDAFNMRAENDEGRFDQNFNFVRKAADPDAVHDTWLNGVSKREVKRAARMHALRGEEVRERELAEEAIPTSKHMEVLITHLWKSETVLEALQRHNKNKAKQPPKRGRKQRSGSDAEQRKVTEVEAQAEKERVAAIEVLTEAADKLSYRGLQGVPDIYDAERELLIRLYQRETGEEWVDGRQPTEDEWWEFRWVSQGNDGLTNGPYTAQQMKVWRDAGYFDAGVGVEYRRLGENDWAKTADFV